MSKPSQHHPWFDVVRGLSALLVCAGHLRAVLMVDFADIEHPALWHQAFYALTGLGHQAVMVFFVLSGFFVGGAVLKPGFEARAYVVARLARLWVVLLPCLLITWALDTVTLQVAPSIMVGAHQAQWHSGPQAGLYDAGALTFLGNALFLQTVAVPIFGSNSPLWSLAHEFWYYVMFPLLAVGAGWAAHGTGSMVRALALGAALLLLVGLPRELVQGFAVWLMGVVAWWCTQLAPGWVRFMAQRLMPLTTGLFLVGLAYSKSKAWQAALGVNADLLLGALFALWCLSLAGPGPALSGWSGRLAKRLSDLSYSLYLSHFPLLMLLAALFVKAPDRLQPGGPALLTFAGALALLLGLGWLVWWLFERHTAQVRRWAVQAWAGLWKSIRL
ncbi:MAG: acyltransferase [Aquabacterium sp.]|uniref:acyltransferase family protein n=1 Tax=Aquabacterium sp. TaxID=1872578 RepID=UPI00271BC350|nr:acyltransferase [Aquabacterium sp.]MDO9002228.1 acyltransferase [Aquabacterium sp.]